MVYRVLEKEFSFLFFLGLFVFFFSGGVFPVLIRGEYTDSTYLPAMRHFFFCFIGFVLFSLVR